MPTRSDGFVKMKERVPYHGKGVDELTTALRRILNDPANKFTQKVVLEVGASHIYLEKMVPEAEAGEIPQLSLHDVIRNCKLEEYEADEEAMDPMYQLLDVYQLIQKEDLEVGFIAIGSKTKFQKWLRIRIPMTDPRIFGTPIKILPELPEDVYVVCGTPSMVADPDDVKFCIKGTI